MKVFKMKLSMVGYKSVLELTVRAWYEINQVPNDFAVDLLGETRDELTFTCFDVAQSDKIALVAEFPEWERHVQRLLKQFILFGPDYKNSPLVKEVA